MRRHLALALAALLTACNGIMQDIYDNPTDDVAAGLPYGYKCMGQDGGTLFFNSTSYTRWTYFDLKGGSSAVIDFGNRTMAAEMAVLEQRLDIDWDVAFHRSVPKTNGGSVAVTRYGSVDEVVQACQEAGGVEALAQREHLVFQPDVWADDVVTLDLSQMLQGIVVYQPSYYNAVLNGWLDVDISNPPPVYTPSFKTYILRLAGGGYHALRLANFRNSKNITAWLTIDYRRL